MLPAHSMEIEVCERMCSRIPCALEHLQIRGVSSGWSNDQVHQEMMVEPPATVEFVSVQLQVPRRVRLHSDCGSHVRRVYHMTCHLFCERLVSKKKTDRIKREREGKIKRNITYTTRTLIIVTGKDATKRRGSGTDRDAGCPMEE